ncbi:SMP-30/gluconolactonase/LRE family protein [Aureimonas jatrophae]|uniref:Sugar lactone lactonase YvrE n=1 Tax=Aureimonas jatrophae TaxID=1166073 RepID=A0A1H0KMZ1_9HYPH|nr:SMP-30/gluconolactonase/LRE family protein [Aureimonas jatrophae]MBB3948785.1 sugar lactone lactonase YvrE [Aureimonas jatrophae]SDO57142.1 Sugar lactone lactonase YvrE [Aureimonas jatrophae]
MTEVAILSDHPCHLGEGPTYDGPSDTLWWFDILEKQLFETKVSAGETTVHTLPTMASALAYVDDAHQLVATADGLYLRDIATGRLQLHTRLEEDNGLTRSNDGRVHPCGALWIGTMGRRAEEGAGSIYHFFRGELTRLYGQITIPNAMCFSPDGRTGYFTDTHAGVLQRVALDPDTGLPTGEPSTLVDHRGGEGGLDGAVVDAEGCIWNARWGAGCIDRYSADGEHLLTIPVPASRPTCPMFVGRDLDRMIVTSAREGLDAAGLKRDAQAGQTFILDPGVRGLPEARVRVDRS